MPVEVNGDRLWSLMETQGRFGGDDAMPGPLVRLPLTDDDKEYRDWLCNQFEEEGLSIRIDAMGNIFGKRDGTNPHAAPVLTGSHGDSHGGKFDGVLGVISGLEVIKTLNEQDIDTERPIEVVNWTNEEISRFSPTMMGSGVWAGRWTTEEMYEQTDTDGKPFGEELDRIGYKGSVPAEPQEDYEAFIELHTEQGPVLELQDKDVGVVTGNTGWERGRATFHGESDHPGPTPIHVRTDALVPAATVIQEIRSLPNRMSDDAVATVGEVTVEPNYIRFIPEDVSITWDIRDPDDDVLDAGVARILEECAVAADREGVEWDWEEITHEYGVSGAEKCVDAVQEAADRLGYDSLRMTSMALHDAVSVSRVIDTSMIFARAAGGKSHAPDEYTAPEYCEKAVNTLANSLLSLATT